MPTTCSSKNGYIVADSVTLSEAFNQWTIDMRDPKLLAVFLHSPSEYFGAHGLNVDNVREILIEGGAVQAAEVYQCGFTCLCTASCCITSVSLPPILWV